MFGIGHYISNKRYTQYAMVPLAWGSSPFARAPALKRLISTLIKVFLILITSFLNKAVLINIIIKAAYFF